MCSVKFFPLLFLFFYLFACSNKVPVNAEKKELWVVYGLLRSYDSVHYIRISKAFLSEKDATLVAKEADYSVKGLEVSLTDGQNTYFAKEINNVPKYPMYGDFYPFTTVYKFTTPPLAAQKNYTLDIRHKADPSLHLWASTTIPVRPTVSIPRFPYNQQLNAYCPDSIRLAASDTVRYSFAANTYYDISFYLNYKENDTLKSARFGTRIPFIPDKEEDYIFENGVVLRGFQAILSSVTSHYTVQDSPLCGDFKDYFGVEVARLDAVLYKKYLSENPIYTNFNDYRQSYTNMEGTQEVVGILGSVGVRRIPLRIRKSERDALRLY